MPTYEQLQHLNPEQFRRACGVVPPTFKRMAEVLQQARADQAPGRPSKFSIEDQVLMTLEYLREYRTYFHIAQSWGINESTVYRIVRRVEDELIASEEFRLPGRKYLLQPEQELLISVVDVVEHPIERPQKNSVPTTQVSAGGIP
jgi:chorismate-pyruvate lyase